MMNHQRVTRSMRKTRSFFHNLAASSLKMRKVPRRQPKSPLKKLQSPKKVVVPSSPSLPSTPMKSSTSTPKSPAISAAFESPAVSVSLPAMAISPVAKISTTANLLDQVSSCDILKEFNLTRAPSTAENVRMAKLVFKTTMPETGALKTVQVEVIKDDTNSFYCLAKWHGTHGLGQFELDGPCSQPQAQLAFRKVIGRNNISDLPLSMTQKPVDMTSKDSRRLVRGFYMGLESGKRLVFPSTAIYQSV
ncbi:hypothetical protein LEN26_002823 [Aphanomyces euteiches]|nr:hypothetical protein AeMF1_019939 [Aphanomyces euteiches]KAH9158659.1 hypothetical protein LEN26_002823 [Aphanomyces euteiches]